MTLLCRNKGVRFIHLLKEGIVREVGCGLSLGGVSAADLVKSMQVKSEPLAWKEKSACGAQRTFYLPTEDIELVTLEARASRPQLNPALSRRPN
jgi:hypothetical protein